MEKRMMDNRYWCYICDRIEPQIPKEELINMLLKEISDELDYVKEYNLTDDDLLDSTSFDIFDSVHKLMSECSEEDRVNGTLYLRSLEKKIEQLKNGDYRLIDGDSSVFRDRYGIIVDCETEVAYKPFKRLFWLDIDQWNNLWQIIRKPCIIFKNNEDFNKAMINIGKSDCIADQFDGDKIIYVGK